MKFIPKEIMDLRQRRGSSTSFRSFKVNRFDLAPGKIVKLDWSVCVIPRPQLFPSALQADNPLKFSALPSAQFFFYISRKIQWWYVEISSPNTPNSYSEVASGQISQAINSKCITNDLK